MTRRPRASTSWPRRRSRTGTTTAPGPIRTGPLLPSSTQAWHAHWSNYFDEVAKRGLFIEVGSPTYHGYLLDAILNVYNFAEDPILRKKAGMVLDLDFADYAQQKLNNIWGGAKSRSYPRRLVRRWR